MYKKILYPYQYTNPSAKLKNLFFSILFIFFSGCTWFYHPATMQLDVPDGPPSFKAGWYDGCRSGLATKVFANSMPYNINYGNGIYQNDPKYQSAWTMSYYTCRYKSQQFTNQHVFLQSPLR